MTENSSTSRAATTSRLPSPTLVICAGAALVAAIGLFLPSLSPVQSTAQTARYGQSNDAGIQIVDFNYAGDLVVQPGQTIQVVNDDGVPHTLTASDGSFDSGVIGGGASGSFATPNADGTFSFICTIHPSMNGELTVAS